MTRIVNEERLDLLPSTDMRRYWDEGTSCMVSNNLRQFLLWITSPIQYVRIWAIVHFIIHSDVVLITAVLSPCGIPETDGNGLLHDAVLRCGYRSHCDRNAYGQCFVRDR